MTRSLKKGPYINLRILEKVKAMKSGDNTVVKVWDRSCTVTPEMVGFTFGVHNGRKHVPIFVTENMVGYKFGDFAPSRTFRKHGGVKAKKAVANT